MASMLRGRRIFNDISKQGKLLDGILRKENLAQGLGGTPEAVLISPSSPRWPLSDRVPEISQLSRKFSSLNRGASFGFAATDLQSARRCSGRSGEQVGGHNTAGVGSSKLLESANPEAAVTNKPSASEAESLGSGAENGGAAQPAEPTSTGGADFKDVAKPSEPLGEEAGSIASDERLSPGSGGDAPVSSQNAEAQAKTGCGETTTDSSLASKSNPGEQATGPQASQEQSHASALGVDAAGSSVGGRPPDKEGEASETPPEVLTRPEPNIIKYIADLFAEAKLAVSIMFLKRTIETGFDLDDFKKGAEVAFRAFMEYYPKGDFQTLRNMVSPMLLKHLQAVWNEFKEQGKVMECTLEDVQGVQVTDMDIFMKSPPFCDGIPPTDAYDANKWLAVSVRFGSTERYKMRGPEGKLISSCIDKRGHVLKFVRQLPGFEKAPLEELESPWYIVNI